MPYVKRKSKIVDAVYQIVLAALLFTVLCLMAYPIGWVFGNFCNWLSGAPMESLELSGKDYCILLGVGLFAAIAATPLALRDYVSNGGYDVVFEPSEEVMEHGRVFGKMLMNQQFGAIYKSFTDELQTWFSVDEFLEELNWELKSLGVPTAIESVQETESGYGNELDRDIDSTIESQPDPFVTVQFSHAGGEESVLTMRLDLNSKTRISRFCFSHYGGEMGEV